LADGSVSACPNIDRSFVQGSIYENDFHEMWESEFRLMRDRSWTRTGICASCDKYKWCHGNAMHLWDIQKKELQFCHYHILEGK
jgi:radical SAM protein with 4Fe4S-binding SPASM domain